MLSTLVNCSVLEVCQKMKRIEMVSKIIDYFKNISTKIINFPTTRFMNASFEKQTEEFEEIKKFNDPVNLDSLKKIILQAKQDAFDESKSLNMIIDISNANYMQADFSKDVDSKDDKDEEDEEINAFDFDEGFDNEDEDDFVDPVDPTEVQSFSKFDEDAQFPVCLEEYQNISPKDNVVAIKNPHSGKITVVKKASLCWFFDNHQKLSSDRIMRVRESEFIPPSRDGNISEIPNVVEELEQISIGDYCLFQIPKQSHLLIGLIKGFANLNESNWKKTAYKKQCVNLTEANKEKVGVAATWFAVTTYEKKLKVYNPGTGFIFISNYRKTIQIPEIISGKRNLIPDSVYDCIKNKVKII